MARKWPQDGDDARIAPNGSVRIAYDADTQTYTYRHPNGDLYEGPPGSEYGPLKLVSRRRQSTDTATAHPPQPPAYPSSGLSPPPYSESNKGATDATQTQSSQRPPAVTFDEILARNPTENNRPVNRPSERELQSSVAANMGPRRSVSLRSIFGSRRRFSPAEEGSDRPRDRILGRSATVREPYPSCRRT
jgi:hypothetical protein